MGASKKLTVRRFFVYLFALLLLVIAKPHPVLYWIGLCFIIAGESLRLWACGHLRKNKDVIMSGPYAHVKNPLYVGTFLIVTGFCIACSNPADPVSRYVLYVALPLFLGVFFLYYLPYKIRVEGTRLLKRFGPKFEDYDRNVPEFFPRLRPYQGPSESIVTWNARLLGENSEYGTFASTAIGCVLVYSKFYFDLV